MFSRLTQGVSSVLHELSGEERSDGDFQDGLVPQPVTAAESSQEGPGPSEEVLERLAQTEQLVVHLKELIREKDSQLASTEKQLKEEKEQAEIKFTKLKMQAKAKMASLNKQITELKGQDVSNSSQNSESSFQMAPGVEEELQQLKEKLSQAELANKMLQQQLWEAEQRVREEGHAEQVRILQAVVKEKDVRFQEQILKHEQELLSLSQATNDADLQQALRASQRRIEELEESLRSRSEVLEMLQQELNSADQQKQILTTQFRQMELELAEAQRLREEERKAEEELQALRVKLEILESERDHTTSSLNAELLKKTAEMDEMRAKLESEEKEKKEMLERLKERETGFEAQLANMKVCLEARMETSESEREQTINVLNINITRLNAELLKKTAELDEISAHLQSEQREKEEMLEKLKEKDTNFEAELANMKASLEARLETESENEQTISALRVELQTKMAELDEMRTKLESEERDNKEILEKFKEREISFEAEQANIKSSLEARLETSDSEKEQIISALNAELQIKITELDEMRAKLKFEECEKQTKAVELDEMRAKLESEERERDQLLEKFKERETSFNVELANIKASLGDSLETSASKNEQIISALNAEMQTKITELDEMRAKLDSEERERDQLLEKFKERETSFNVELANIKASLGDRLESSASENEQIISALNAEMQTKITELDEMRAKLKYEECEKQTKIIELDEIRAKLESEERERDQLLEKFKQRETSFEAELSNLKSSLEARLETSDSEKEQTISALKADLQKKTAEFDDLMEKLTAEEKEWAETLQERQTSFDRELSNLQGCLEVTEKQKEEMTKQLEMEATSHMEKLHHLQEKLDEVERAREEESKNEKDRLAQMQNEFESLRETLGASNAEQKAGLQAKNALEKLWKGIQSLTTSGEAEVEISVPTDPAQILEVLPALQTRLSKLTDEQQESQARLSQITLTLQSLQGQLDKSTAEGEESVARIQELEQQLVTVQVSGESLGDHVTDLSVRDLGRTHQDNTGDGHSSENQLKKDRILFLEQQLAEREEELFALREKLSLTTSQSLNIPEESVVSISRDIAGLDNSDVLEVSQEEETTLVAVDASVLSVSGGNDSSPELIAPQPGSPGESKGTSSDEMVTSSDSEVAHSSWTLLEAVNQDATQEWQSHIQDFASLRLSTQSWEETSEEQIAPNSCIVDIEAPSLVIHETVQVRLAQQEGSLLNTDPSTGQTFAQVLAEEIQKRYSEILGELQQFKDSALQSQEKVYQLEEALESLTAYKNEAESRANIFEKELIETKELIKQEKFDGQSAAEQFQNLKEEVQSKDDKLQILQAAFDEAQQRLDDTQQRLDEAQQRVVEAQQRVAEAQQRLDEQEGQARMLAAQLEERELSFSELEQKLLDIEGRLVQVSHEADTAKATIVDRTAELEDLQKCLSQKDQEMMELSNSMSVKLLQAGEEKFALSGEVKKLKDQINELESIKNDQQKVIDGQTSESEQFVALRKEKEDLATQMAAMKKDGEHIKRKLQAALIQRKELMKKVADFEKEAESREDKEKDGYEEITIQFKNEIKEKELEIQRLDALLQETRDVLNLKEETLVSLKQKISNQDQALTESHAEIQRLTEQYVEINEQHMSQVDEDKNRLLSQIASMESEIETMREKFQQSTDAYEDAVMSTQEKERHHLEQTKQMKEECRDLLEQLNTEKGEKTGLLNRIMELEGLLESKNTADKVESVNVGPTTQNLEKPETNDWGQEDWVDFATTETETPQEQSQQPMVKNSEDIIDALQEELKFERAAHADLQVRLHESQSSQSLTDSKFKEVCKEHEALKEKERHIDALTEEIETLREKCQRAEAHAEKLKVEVDEAWEAAKRSISDAESPIKALQSEVEEFKQFLKCKNDEIVDLSQQLSEQSSLLLKMQETVQEKDQQIVSLQQGLKTEQDRVQKLEAELPQREEEEKDNGVKLQQLQRKLQAALVSRKEALKEKQALKEEQAAAEKNKLELHQKLELIEMELHMSREEREKLIKEVDRTLLENQSLSASCESLKLAMEGVLNEKDACKRQAEIAKEESEQVCRQLEEKVQNMKEEYESLLKSYENVSDEAERVRKVLEAARQERQELATKARAHEAARQEAERLAEEATKEVDVVKDKMRKFAKVKHQKIMDLEEENERLREQEEKKLTKHTETDVKQELERIKQELEILKANYNKAVDDKKSLELEAEELRLRLEEIDRKGVETLDTCSVETIKEVKVIAQQNSPDLIEIQEYQCDSIFPEANLTKPLESIHTEPHQEVTEVQTKIEITTQTEERLKELETSYEIAENKIKELEGALEDHMESRNNQILDAELTSIKQQLQESLEREGIHKEEISKKENQLQELRRNLEAERDDLEERLMNQLAQLNGSIAGYQQEASDGRDRLTDMQRDLEKLERERAELEAEVLSERDRAARMEEDMRQAHRERAEAEAETGKQRELEQKLKSAQRFKEGSQNRTRQLEELLREKQLEVRQLQKDCIGYQERISELAKEVKSLLLVRDEVRAELEAARLEIAYILQDKATIASELSTYKGKLDMALEEAKQAQADKLSAEQFIQRKEAELTADAERTLDEVRYRLGAELKQIELRLEKSYRDREREEEATLEARRIAEAADRHAQEMQARLDEALARLAAFSRSMSSLQDDRDRVLDEAKQWENRFHSELQEKEADVREAETRAKELAEQLQREMTQKEELQSLLERTQKGEENLQLELSSVEKKHNESLAALEKEREDLQQKLTLVEINLSQAHSQLASLETEAEGLRHRTKALDEAVDKLRNDAVEARAVIKERETEERRLCLMVEQLETDLGSSKNLTETLQVALGEKEKREVELLGEKEQAVTQAVEEARKDADARAEMAENELEKRREELRGLEERLRKAEEDTFQSRAQLESFTKAMGSLQDDRDRVLSQYKQLEEKHLQVMMEKDSLIQEAAGENNRLKEELRALLSQRDDLNADNAKLAAQLHGYRNDLNQVLTMKDSQHKQILATQVERISFLEREREDLVNHIQALERDIAQGKAPLLEQENSSQASEGSVDKQDAPGAEVEKLREQLQAARKRITNLEETLELEKETQTVHSKELKELQWEGCVLRTEAETAEERVAELARDLLMMEQQLLEEREAVSQLRVQNQSFGQAMATLQDARDQAVNEAKELRLRFDDINRTGHAISSPSDSKGEVWSLKNALSALQNDRERMLEQMQVQRSELDRLTQALEAERRRAVEQDEKAQLSSRDVHMDSDKQELEMLRLERMDWQGQAELLKQQTLTTLSARDQQIRQLTAMLEEVQASKLQHEHTQRQGRLALDAAPGGPLEHNEGYKAECIELQRRLDEESELRLRIEEQLIATEDRLKRYTQGEWQTPSMMSETAVLIEPQEGAVTRTRSGGPGLLRMLRVAFCSRQRTPLLVSLYLLTVHVLLLLCFGGYL